MGILGSTLTILASFRKYLYKHIIEIVEPAEAHLVKDNTSDSETEREWYRALLKIIRLILLVSGLVKMNLLLSTIHRQPILSVLT